MKRLLTLVNLMIVTAAVLCAAGVKEQTEPIRIGALYALSGPNESIGVNIMRGIDYAAMMINDQGGIDGRRLEIVKGDTEGDVEKGKAEALRLITEEGVSAIIGCHQSVITEEVARICEEYRVPMISAISTVDSLSTLGLKYFFRLCPMNTVYVESQFRYLEDLSKQTGEKIYRISVFADSSSIGDELVRCASLIAPEYGMRVVRVIQYDTNAEKLVSEVQQLRSSHPDAVLVESYTADAILFTKTLKEQKVSIPVIVAKANGFIDPSYIPSVGEISNGIASVVEWNSDLPDGQTVNDGFVDEYGVDMNGHAAEAFTAVWLLKTAFDEADSTDGPTVRDTLASIDIQGAFPDGPEIILPYDRIRFGELMINGTLHSQTNIYASVAIAQIQDSAYKTVWPFELSSTEVQYPAAYE